MPEAQVMTAENSVPNAEPSIEDGSMIPYEPETAGVALFEMANPEDPSPPDDYLESSEHLLKSLKREEAKVEVERGFLQSLSTPLGIGSMLTLLMSSAMLGYVIMNPSILSGIGQKVAETPTAETPVSESTSATIANSPPLDRDEFSELGLDTLSVLRTKPAPVAIVASPTPSPTAPNAIIAPSPSIVPAPVTSSSVLLPSISVPKTTTPPLPATPQVPNRQYKVEIPFTGDQSLAVARQVVPDAFVRSDGKIQLAATLTEEAAQKKAQDLKNRGIAAEIRQP